MSLPDLAYYLPLQATCEDVSLYGQRVAERYDDATLAVLANFPRLAKLELLNHHITRIPRGLRALRHAWIGQSPGLATLEGIEDAVGLQRLMLSNLPGLDLADAFERLAGLPELVYLSLGGEQVRQLPAAFARLPKLAHLELAYTPGLDLDQAFAMIAQVPTVRVLELGKIAVPASIGTLSQLRVLTVAAKDRLPDELGALAALEELHLPKATCKSLPGSIGKLSRLTKLELYESKVAALPDEIGACQSLQAIQARSSALRVLPASIGRLAALHTLDVYNTKLKKLPRSMGALENLRVLEVSYDKPIEIPDEIYQLSLEKFTGPQEVLDKLVLRRLPTPDRYEALYSEAARLPDDFGGVGSLQLALHEHAAPIPQLARLPRVEQVTIDTGNLGDAFARLASAPRLWRVAVLGERDALPASIANLTQVTTLEIDSGPWGDSDQPGTLRELPAALGELAGLEALVLRRHRLTEPPEVLGELASLEKLTLSAGELRALPRSLGKLQHLRKLEIHGITELHLPDELARCAALEAVTLHGGWGPSRIDNLAVLGRLPGLRQLWITYVRQPQDWAGLLAALGGSALELLDLEHSELGVLPAEIGGLARLRRLVLEHTGIKELPPELRACTELCWMSWSSWQFSEQGRAQLKKQLPPGRWRKQKRDRVEFYERTA
ncbi:MAG: hypothetical protein IT370_09765 [Deltaproteobacteria bacterium]|nr:hypothetical protein [Deltaproteobacteria bacterium]